MREYVKRVLPVLVLAVLGLGISIAVEVVHRRLASDVTYTSFCNVNASVNCDAVLASRYASLAGVSVAAWAIVYYLALLGIVIGIARVERAQLRETLGAVTLVSAAWGLLFSLYMATIAFAVLHTVCLMCSALYLVNIGMFLAAWRLRAGLRVLGRRQAAERSGKYRWVLAGSVVAAVALIVIGSWEALGRGGRPLDPDFHRWFLAQPVMQVPLDDSSNSRGSTTAAVTIVEFSDFECGHCAAFHARLQEVLRRTAGNVRVVFRHFPLDSSCNPKVNSRFHPEACLAAVASECAAEQGKFWEYHNLLFDNQQRLGRESLIAYAKRVALDMDRFSTCLGSEQARARVERDARIGAELGVESTPTVFINGRTIKGALERDQLIDALALAGGDR
jgi:protein-disulfide isomerase/uncharacterized membrane protein